MTDTEELANLRQALADWVADLRRRGDEAKHNARWNGTAQALEGDRLHWQADEIEARFLTDDAWKRITSEPVFAYGERVE